MKKLVAMLSVMILLVLAIVPVVSANAEAAGTTRYVSSENGKGVRMRKGNSTEAEVIFNLGEGRPVTVHAEAMGWSQVSVKVNGKVYNGYVMSKFLSKNDPSLMKQTFKKVSKMFVRVRAASADGAVSIWNTTSKLNVNKVRDLTRTEKITVLAESRAWYKVQDQFGNTGYVAKAYVTPC